MSNSIYGQFKKQPTNPMQMLDQLRQNPVSFLKQAGYNIPDGMDNPNQIIQHLMNSGQVNQNRLTQAQIMARNFMR